MPRALITWFKSCLVILTLAASLAATVIAEEPSVKQWDIFEISLPGTSHGNPFMDVQLSARFSLGTSTVEVAGFYDGNGIYRVRFMPDRQGSWHYTTRSSRPELDGKTGDFIVVAPGAGNHGPVHVANTYHFAYADATPFRPLGTTAYNWVHMADPLEEQTLTTLRLRPSTRFACAFFPNTMSEPRMNWRFTRLPERRRKRGILRGLIRGSSSTWKNELATFAIAASKRN